MAEEKIVIGRVTIEEARGFVREHTPLIVELINRVRETYAKNLNQKIAPVTQEQVQREVDRLFSDWYVALNLAVLIVLSTTLEAEEDYEAFIVDEILGQAIAETIAAGVPYRNFAQSTFYLLDSGQKEELHRAVPRRSLATDDALAGIAAGLEAILPGWEWMERPTIPSK